MGERAGNAIPRRAATQKTGGRHHKTQRAQRAAALRLTQIARCSSGQYSGDGGVRSYPLFSFGRGRDFFPAVTKQKCFAPGDTLTVYKSPKGRFSLEPEPLHNLFLPLQLCRFSLWGCSSSAFW